MKKLAATLASLSLVAFSGAALAADHGAGKAKAEPCMDCHFADDFAGMSADEIEAAIRAAIAGDIRHDAAIKDTPEEDIPAIAAYFAHEGAQ